MSEFLIVVCQCLEPCVSRLDLKLERGKDASMQTRNFQSMVWGIVLSLTFILIPLLVLAQQSESSVACDEGVVLEPLQINYGDHTVNCEIDAPTELDQFTFVGSADDNIRITVLSTTTNMDPTLEVRDPEGTVIATKSCGNFRCSFTLDLSLTLSGTYLLALYDGGANETGGYQVNLACLFGACPPSIPPPVCDIQMSQTSYTGDETVTAQVFRLANLNPNAVAVEWKVWVTIPDGISLPLVNVGADRSLILPPGFDHDFGPVALGPATRFPLGTYELNCRLLDPVTGRPIICDHNPFEIQ